MNCFVWYLVICWWLVCKYENGPAYFFSSVYSAQQYIVWTRRWLSRKIVANLTVRVSLVRILEGPPARTASFGRSQEANHAVCQLSCGLIAGTSARGCCLEISNLAYNSTNKAFFYHESFHTVIRRRSRSAILTST
jgi:hypothetical protein